MCDVRRMVCRLLERGWPRTPEAIKVAHYVARCTFEALDGFFQGASQIRVWLKAIARELASAGAAVR
jgi:hypothetical protein